MRYKPQDCWSIDFGVAFPRADALGAGYVAPKGFTFFISHKHGGDFTEQKLCNNRRYCKECSILRENGDIIGSPEILSCCVSQVQCVQDFFMLRKAPSTPGEQNVGAQISSTSTSLRLLSRRAPVALDYLQLHPRNALQEGAMAYLPITGVIFQRYARITIIVISVPKSRTTEKMVILLDAGFLSFGRSPLSSSLVRRLMTAVANSPAFRCRGHSSPGIVTVLRFIACRAQECL